MNKNPFVRSVRPIETRLEDYLDQDNSYKIAIVPDGVGGYTATTNVNGHVFSASASEFNKALAKVQVLADNAIDDGLTVHEKV
jgi:hypothetical protein